MGCDWQSSCKTISDSIGYMYSKGLYTDCSFLVGQGDTTVFKAHKHVLVGVSPVFECMFYGEIPEQANEIHVPDVDPTTFDKFLSAVYSDALELNTFEEACNMFYAANKYMVQKIKDPCLVYIIENINFSNAAEAYELLMLFGQEGAAQDCMKIIQSETSEVVASDGFTSIKKETLLEILKSDSLEIDNELELYNAAVRWIEAEIVRKELKEESDKRALYREILGCIRFLSMNEKDFARGPARECYLSKDETLAVLLNILDPDNPLALPDNFSSEKRKHARNKEKITLFEAAKRGRIDIMAELEEQGEDLKTRENGWSLLHWTAQNGHLEATDWLLKKGLDPSWTNSRGENVLCSAVYSGRLDVVKLVRQSQWQSPTLGLHGSSFSKNTPLAIARDFNLTDIILGNMTLWDAAKCGRVDIMAELAERGEDLTARVNGWTLLHFTAQNGHLEATDWLLKKGLDPSLENSIEETVLHSAVHSGREDLVKLVIESCALHFWRSMGQLVGLPE